MAARIFMEPQAQRTHSTRSSGHHKRRFKRQVWRSLRLRPSALLEPTGRRTFDCLRTSSAKRFRRRRQILVVNDAVGALWTGTNDGHGVAAAIGTYASVAASGPGGTWHSSFWSEPAGAVHLAEAALRGACRAELGTGPGTALRERMVTAGGFSNTEQLLHHYTCRERPPRAAIARFARLILDVAESGDEVARSLVRQQSEAVSRSVRAAVRRAGLQQPYTLVLTGGLFNHGSSLMADAMSNELPDAHPVVTRLEPATGVALMASHVAGFPLDRGAAVEAVGPELLRWRAVETLGHQAS